MRVGQEFFCNSTCSCASGCLIFEIEICSGPWPWLHNTYDQKILRQSATARIVQVVLIIIELASSRFLPARLIQGKNKYTHASTWLAIRLDRPSSACDAGRVKLQGRAEAEVVYWREAQTSCKTLDGHQVMMDTVTAAVCLCLFR